MPDRVGGQSWHYRWVSDSDIQDSPPVQRVVDARLLLFAQVQQVILLLRLSGAQKVLLNNRSFL